MVTILSPNAWRGGSDVRGSERYENSYSMHLASLIFLSSNLFLLGGRGWGIERYVECNVGLPILTYHLVPMFGGVGMFE